jgi:predicted permease
MLVVAAGLFVRALAAATRVDPGFAVDSIEVASIDLALGGYPDARAAAVAEEIRTRLATIPGADAVEIAAMVPLSGGGLGLGALRPAGAADDVRLEADWNVVSPGFLAATSTALVRGRHFTPADRDGAPLVAIVNARLAAHLWPGRDPGGQVLEHGDLRPGREASIRRLTVVGVARDVKYRWLGDQPRHFVYVPLAQTPMRSLSFFLRHPQPIADGASLQPAVRQALRAFDPNLPLIHMAPLASFAELGLLPQRIAAALAATLGVVALALAAIGVYGVTAYAVASRTREIGIRLAIGASPGRVIREMAGAGIRVVAIGVTVGLAGAAAVMPLVASLLFGVPPHDPLTFGVTAAALGSIGLLASYLPARRAAGIAPVIALRAE